MMIFWFYRAHFNTPSLWRDKIWTGIGLLFLSALSLTLLASGAHAAQNAPLITSTALWEDTTAEATFEQAQQQTYTPYQHNLNKGFTRSAHWIRLDLRATDTPTSLYITPTWVDEITLYDPAQPNTIYNAGDNNPRGVNVQQTLGYTLALPASAQPRNLWIRLKSDSVHRLQIQAQPSASIGSVLAYEGAITALFVALLIILFLALLGIWVLRPEKVLGIYLIRHTMFSIYAAFYFGLPPLILPAYFLQTGWLDTAFSFFVTITLPIGLWFDFTLLSAFNPRPVLLKTLKGMALLGLISPILVFTHHAQTGLILTSNGLMLAALLVFITAMTTQPRPEVDTFMPTSVMRFYYALILSGLVLGIINLRGWLPPNTWSQHILIMHGLASGLTMSVLLFIRGQRQYRHHQTTVLALRQAQKEAQQEQQRREEQSKFLHMLMHELKTPLSVVSLALGTQSHREENLAHAGRAVQDMKAIIDRCVQADQMDEFSLQRRHDTIDLPALLAELSDNMPGLGSRLQLHTLTQIPPLKTDKQLLQIVLTNLLDNASRYSDPLTPVTVSVQAQARRGQSGLCVQVGNTPGLAGWPDEQKLFDKYYRAVGAQRESGSGLGLFLSRQLAQSLGGTLDYTPSTQQVEFVLWIPQSPV